MKNTDIRFHDLNGKIMLFLKLECKIYRIELYENGYLNYSMLKNTKSSWDDIIDSLCCEFEWFVLIVLFSIDQSFTYTIWTKTLLFYTLLAHWVVNEYTLPHFLSLRELLTFLWLFEKNHE